MMKIFSLLFSLLFLFSCSNHNSDGPISKLYRSLASGESIESQASSLKSIINEINTNGTKVVHVYAYPKNTKVSNWDSSRVVTALSKMKQLRKDLLIETSDQGLDPTSAYGQKVLVTMVDYLYALVTLHKIYVQIAHTPLLNSVANSSLSYNWDIFKNYQLIVDKRFALILLAKVNFMAHHFSSTDLKNMGLTESKIPRPIEITLGGEVKHLLEHIAISDPTTTTGYAYLLKYSAMRETIINTWGLNRIATTPYEGSVGEDGYAKQFLSLRPGTGGKFTNSEYYKELLQSDTFYNVYAPNLPNVIAKTLSTKTKSMAIATPEEYAELFRILAWGYPENSREKTIKPVPFLRDYFFGLGKFDGYSPYTKADFTMLFPGQVVVDAEEQDWNDLRVPNLLYTAFVGDDLSVSSISNKMASEAWEFRSKAAIAQIKYNMAIPDISKSESEILEDKVTELINRWGNRYKSAFKAEIEPLLNTFLTSTKIISIKKDEKYKSVMNTIAMTEADRGQYVLNHIEKNNTIRDMPTKMYPRTPESLVSLIRSQFNNFSYRAQISIEDNDTYASVVNQLFKDISTAFYKVADPKDSFDKLTGKLWAAAVTTAQKYYKKYPLTQKDRDQMYYLEKSKVVRDNTNVVLQGVGYTRPSNSIGGDITPSNGNGNTTPKKDSAFDMSLNSLMLNFQTDVSAPVSNANKSQWVAVPLQQLKSRSEATYYDVKWVLDDVYRFLGISTNALENGTASKLTTVYFANSEEQQRYLAGQAISMAYASAPLLQNKLFYSSYKKLHYATKAPYEETINVYKTCLEAITLKAFDAKTNKSNTTTAYDWIAKSVNAGFSSLKGKSVAESESTPFNEGLLETFAKSKPKYSDSDERFQFMYDVLENLRNILIYQDGRPKEYNTKMAKFDKELYKKIHPWKYLFDEYIEPAINVIMIAVMVISLIVGFVFPPAAIPAWLATTLFVFDVGTFVFTMGTNIGYRIVYQRMYEIPANLKMQTHLAYIQSHGESPVQLMYNSNKGTKSYKVDTPLDFWDRIKQAEQENIDMRRELILERLMWLPLDLMWGTAILKQGKNLIGLSTVKAMKKMGLPHLTFNQKIKVFFNTEKFGAYIKDKGLIRGTMTIAGEVITQAPKLLPKYQPYSKEILQKFGLRVGLYNKLENIIQNGTHIKQGEALMAKAEAGYALEGENILIWKLFNEIKAADKAHWQNFLKMKEGEKVHNLMADIQVMIDKGITPAEIINTLPKRPKTIFGVLFNGVSDSGRWKNFTAALTDGEKAMEALGEFRAAKIRANTKVLEELTPMLTPGFNFEESWILIKEAIAKGKLNKNVKNLIADGLDNKEVFEKFKVIAESETSILKDVTSKFAPNHAFEYTLPLFENAGMKIGFKNAFNQIKKNYDDWRLTKAPEYQLAEKQMKLQNMIHDQKHVRSQKFVDKCIEVERLLSESPTFYENRGFNTALDFWMSTLDHSDLLMWKEWASRGSKAFLKAGTPDADILKQTFGIFKEYDIIIETIRPLEWMKAADNVKATGPVGLLESKDFNYDYSDIQVNDGNFYTNDKLGDQKSGDIKLLEGDIEDVIGF